MTRPSLADSLHDRGGSVAGGSESHAALFHIGTRYVQFNGVYSRQLRYALGCGNVLLHRRARHIHHYLGVKRLEFRIYLCGEMLHALVLKPHSVQHTRGRFSHTGVGIAFARLKRRALDYKAAKTLQIEEISVFKSVAECTRRG